MACKHDSEGFFLYVFGQTDTGPKFKKYIKVFHVSAAVVVKQEKIEFSEFLKLHDPAYYEQIIAAQSNFFDGFEVTQLEKSRFNKQRVLYCNPNHTKLILDFKLLHGRITGWNNQHYSMGVRNLEKTYRFDIIGENQVWLMRDLDGVLSCSFEV